MSEPNSIKYIPNKPKQNINIKINSANAKREDINS